VKRGNRMNVKTPDVKSPGRFPEWVAVFHSTNGRGCGILNNMSENVLAIEDAARSLSEVVERVHTSGEPALLTRFGQPVARIVPVASDRQTTENLVAFLRHWRIAHPEPDEQFGEAIEDSRRAVHPPHDPWE
jgi:prevent-host-death family protein